MCCGQKRKSVDTSKKTVAAPAGASQRPVSAPPGLGPGRGGRDAPVSFVK
jgi:hypothetical protein